MRYILAEGAYRNTGDHEHHLLYEREHYWKPILQEGVFDTRVQAMRHWLFRMDEIPSLDFGNDDFIKQLFKPFQTNQKMVIVLKE